MNVELNDLPEKILVFVFERFDLLEKLKLRLVCLKWKRIIENFKIKDLSIVDSFFNKSDKWGHLGLESANYQNLIYYSNPPFYQRLAGLFKPIRSEKPSDSLQLISRYPMFFRVKSMFISLNSIENFCFKKHINSHFLELEQLFCFDLNLGNTCLSLPNLKVLALFALTPLASKPIRLELPNMFKLLTNLRLDYFEFVHPQSVTHLVSPDYHKSIVQLFNLEYLACLELSHESVTLFKLPKLKEIHHSLLLQKKDTKKRIGAFYQAKQSAIRHQLKMFVQEVDYETYRRSPTFPFTSKEVIQSFVSGKLVSSPVLSLTWSLVYDDLLEAFGGPALSSKFKSSFPNLKKISAHQKTRYEIESFFKFLSYYPNIEILEVICAFDQLENEQACYNRLSACCRYVRKLTILKSGPLWPTDWNPIDLNFILRFGYLQRLESNLHVKPDFIELLFEKLKYFCELEERNMFSNYKKITKSEGYFGQYYLLLTAYGESSFYSLSKMLAFLSVRSEENYN